ncbi:ABC transporter permease [Xanthovirga aplysinae]|uniref:ABC transporter permease n=1 Tax=Xanthovirga aplysinae TaxID=2529853 RepID=UPI0012BC6831|nr:ABC transporter permease [Xanthovirga aplysinae]MTI33111.1 FtsX-like permease family protein [Xanthovirga aplysinae]
MIKNYFILAWRNLLKNRFLSFTNIGVLALVIAAVLHLFKYVAFEKSFDKFHENYEELYRVNTHLETPNGSTDYAISHGFLGNMVKNKFKSVENYVTLTPLPDDCTIVYGDAVFRETRVYEVDSTFFQIFSFPLLAGDPATVLKKPKAVVLTESMAKKYFKNEDPLGKSVTIKGKFYTDTYEITGICKDFPENSHIQMDWICSNQLLFQVPKKYYDFDKAMNHWTYLRIKGNEGPENLIHEINQEAELKNQYSNADVQISLSPIEKIHLESSFQGELREVNGGYNEIVNLVILLGAGCFFITWLNFVNISLVKTLDRNKEVGIRKVLGAGFADNLKLFFMEALIQMAIALFLGFDLHFITVDIVSEYFNFPVKVDTGKQFLLYSIFTGGFFILSLVISLIYALIFSKTEPLHTMKSRGKVLSKKITKKTAPIIAQFTICVLFLSFTLVVFQQINFIYQKDLGYKTDKILFLMQPHLKDWMRSMNSKMQAFDTEAKKIPQVEDITRAVYAPGSNSYAIWGGVSNDKTGKDNFQMVAHNEVMHNYFDFYDMKLLAGNFFTKESSEKDIIVNYSACREMGYSEPEDILDTEVFVKHKRMNKRVVGVIGDFNQESLKFKTKPVMFHLDRNNMQHTIAVKLSSGNFNEAITKLEQSWKQVFPESEFVYSIFTDNLKQLYENEARFQKWLNLFCFLTLIVCSFGIFIITYYTFKEREKEIAIHKVLGASTIDIMGLSKSFVWLIGISIIAGLSIGYLTGREWLQHYAYHVSIGIWFFIVPVLIVSFFFLITLFYSVKKAVLNTPVRALRGE